MANTTNFGWETPDDTDLVKDGAAAMRTLGNSIDASFVDLKGGTTGQVLSKNSNTDLDFTWVAQDDSNAIQNSIVDAKGDLISASAADVPARLAVGANNLFLTAASGETTGLKWAGDWVSWTPTLNNITIGNGTRTGKYARIGNTVIFWLKITLGSTSSVSNEPGFQFPVTATQGYPHIPLINFVYEDSGGTRWTGSSDPIGNDQTNCRFWVGVASGTYLTTSGLSSTVPFTWGTSDVFWATGIYEVS